MAAPVFQTADTGVATSGTTVAVTKPTGLANNDIVIVAIAGSDSATCSAPDGTWTEHLDTVGTEGGETLAIYSHVVTNAAGEPASWTFTHSVSGKRCGGALRISGADTTTPVVVTGTPASSTAQGTSAVANSITPGVIDCLLIQCSAMNGNQTWTADGAMTERVDVQSGGGGGGATKASLEMSTETLSGSGATGTRTATLATSTPWTTVLLAVQPPVSSSAIKTVGGLAKASVKTVNGLAITSVKTINGLA